MLEAAGKKRLRDKQFHQREDMMKSNKKKRKKKVVKVLKKD